MDTNYRIEALDYLLDKSCLAERYYPLIHFKHELIIQAKRLGYKTKNDLAVLSDAGLSKLGISDEGTVGLFRKFLTLYDPNPQKFKKIEKLNIEADARLAFRELYYLPGVKYIRALLYYLAGFKSLKSVAEADAEEIRSKTALAIAANQLSCIVPLPKEVHTHIAVSKAFTQETDRN